MIGDTIGDNATKATFVGNRFVGTNMDGGGSDMVLTGSKLEGLNQVKAGRPKFKVTYTKQ